MNDVVKEAREWVDTPFRHQGRLKGVGCDCLGLIRGVYGNVYSPSILPKDRTNYGIEIVVDLNKHLRKVAVEVAEREPGDLILMKFSSQPTHMGIYVGDDRMIHAYSSVGRIVEHRISSQWKKRIVSIWRMTWPK